MPHVRLFKQDESDGEALIRALAPEDAAVFLNDIANARHSVAVFFRPGGDGQPVLSERNARRHGVCDHALEFPVRAFCRQRQRPLAFLRPDARVDGIFQSICQKDADIGALKGDVLRDVDLHADIDARTFGASEKIGEHGIDHGILTVTALLDPAQPFFQCIQVFLHLPRVALRQDPADRGKMMAHIVAIAPAKLQLLFGELVLLPLELHLTERLFALGTQLRVFVAGHKICGHYAEHTQIRREQEQDGGNIAHT